jgi:hypothetical protein
MMAAFLNDVDSNGVSQEVLGRMENFRAWRIDHPNYTRSPATRPFYKLTLDIAMSQRDAEYIVECLRLLLRQEAIAQRRFALSLDDNGISDSAIDVFGDFLRETTMQCHLRFLHLCSLPPRQIRRLLAALRSNRSVKTLCIDDETRRDNEGASWIADVLRHKTDFTCISIASRHSQFPFMQILSSLREQRNLQTLHLFDCRTSSGALLFQDPESTQLFVDNVLMSPSTTIKTLSLCYCGLSSENRPLMAGFHKNTTVVELNSNLDAATWRFIDPILQRNRYLCHVHDMLVGGTINVMIGTVVGDDEIVEPNNTTPQPPPPPPLGLWATVLGKVGRIDTQGATPVFTILCNRLATWIPP